MKVEGSASERTERVSQPELKLLVVRGRSHLRPAVGLRAWAGATRLL